MSDSAKSTSAPNRPPGSRSDTQLKSAHWGTNSVRELEKEILQSLKNSPIRSGGHRFEAEDACIETMHLFKNDTRKMQQAGWDPIAASRSQPALCCLELAFGCRLRRVPPPFRYTS
jgi:hypothetical protein